MPSMMPVPAVKIIHMTVSGTGPQDSQEFDDKDLGELVLPRIDDKDCWKSHINKHARRDFGGNRPNSYETTINEL